jgi:hypothetical protein
VIRPVGHSGKLVQVLDPNRDPEVLDADRLERSRSWTGLALVPRRSSRSGQVFAGLLALGAAAAALPVLRQARRRPGAFRSGTR